MGIRPRYLILVEYFRNHDLHLLEMSSDCTMSDVKLSEFPCFICAKIYHTKDYLLLHTKIHAGEKSFTCEKCPKAFVNITALKKHLQTHNVASHMCPNCGLYFKTIKSLKIHSIIHSRDTDKKVEVSKEVIATAVQKVLAGCPVLKVAEDMKVSYQALNRWLSVARKENPCSFCGKCFPIKFELDRHVKSKHAGITKQPPEIGRKSDGEFKATVLEYFKTNGKRETVAKFKISESTLHSWSILAQKPLKCPTCDFKAPSKSKFERHMCRFSDEQPHLCSLCDLNLNSAKKLRKHMKKVHNQNERTSQNGNKNELREFLQNMNTAGELNKENRKMSETKILPKSPQQIKALNNVLKGYRGAGLTSILKSIQCMSEPDIEKFLQSHQQAKPKPVEKEIKVKDEGVAKTNEFSDQDWDQKNSDQDQDQKFSDQVQDQECSDQDQECSDQDWDFVELKKEWSGVKGEFFWPEEIQLDRSAIAHEGENGETSQIIKESSENGKFKETNKVVKFEEIDANHDTGTAKVDLKEGGGGITAGGEDEMTKMRLKLEEMRRNMREMEALMEARIKEKAFAKKENKEVEAMNKEVNKERAFKRKEDVNDPSENIDDKTPAPDVGKIVEKKSLEMLDGDDAGDTADAIDSGDTIERNHAGDAGDTTDGNYEGDRTDRSDGDRNVGNDAGGAGVTTGGNEGAHLKGGEGEVDLKTIFSSKEAVGKAKQKFEQKKKRRLKTPTEDIEGQNQSEERTESQIGTHLIGTLCKDCGAVLTRDFKNHLLSHTGLRNFLCTFCSKTFILKSHLARHTRVLHTDGQMAGKLSESLKGTTCNECGEVLARDFRRHLEGHSGKNYVCKFCSKTFMLKATLTGHTRTFHSNENIHMKDIPVKIHECAKCNFKSHLRDSLVRHNVNIHKAPRPKICIDCGKGFYKNVYLNNHVCPVKGKIREAPKKKTTRICSQCDIKFKFKEGLFRHNTNVHGLSKPLSCAECGKGFVRNANLVIHSRVHTGEKPNICEVCGSGFIDQSGLTRHKEKH